MTEGRAQKLEVLLLAQLPQDGTAVGNAALLETLKVRATEQGFRVNERDFQATRDRLVAAGLARKGKGRGGSTARAASNRQAVSLPPTDEPPPFALVGQVVPAELQFAAPAPSPKRGVRASAAASPGEPQVLSYRHADRRVNNPEVGLVSEASDPQRPKTVWAYDPHLDPVLNFDGARARAEKLIDDALASGDDPAKLRSALEELRRMGRPYLQWTGKAERTSFELDTVSLHVHERIDPMSILSAVSKAGDGKTRKEGKKRSGGIQPGLFEAPFESLPLRDAVDFYRHDKGWSNRLIAGDSLLVMNSLLQKESMAGQVQMIYIDPPYGIKYGSNFQPFVNKRDVKDRADADLTQEPEMIKAFRDTWELGVHSYLTYLRDRLLLSRELLAETGSVFVQISDENLHYVRELMDEVFDADNFVAQIVIQKTGGFTKNTLGTIEDYVVWYARDLSKITYHDLREHDPYPPADDTYYRRLQLPNGSWRWLTKVEAADRTKTQGLGRIFRHGPLNSDGPASNPKTFRLNGLDFPCNPNRHWTIDAERDMPRVARSGHIFELGNDVAFKLFWDFNPAKPKTNVWLDTQSGGFNDEKVYAVQTTTKVIERCLLMTTAPGDLVLDPTCGSGTTAVVAEKWGRRWITCDTSRVAVTLAKQRLMTASYDYFELRYPHEGLKGGFIYKTVPHVTLKSIANNPEIDSIYERLHPLIESALSALNAALRKHPPSEAFAVTEGVRKGEALKLGRKGADLYEWEVPFPREGNEPLPDGWPSALREPFEAFHAARRRMQAEMDRSIAAHADSETLYDQPEKARNKLRISGPFSVEAVPFPTVLRKV